MRVAVLGPVRLEGPAGPVAVPGRKAREVLATLAVASPRPVSVDRLVAVLWDDAPPSAVKTVQAHVSRVRSALAAVLDGEGGLRGGPAGYHLEVATAQLDVTAVAELRRTARVAALAGDDRIAAELLAQARQLWRGEPELPATTTGGIERARLAEEHLQMIEDHLAAEVAAGDVAGAVGELEALTAQHPLRERLWELRMRGLYRCGRQSDALAAFRAVRGLLVDEVGVEPGPALRALAAAILDHSAALAPPAPAAPVRAPVVAADVPRYAEAGGVHVAYGIYGSGPVDVLLLNPTFVPVDAYLEEPRLAAAVGGLARGRRVIAFDRRGLGLSDPVTADRPPSVAQWRDDAVAVLDACGAGRVHVFANGDTGVGALLLAATRPERVASVTLVNGYARMSRAADYPIGMGEPLDPVLREIRALASPPALDVLAWIAPSVADDPRFRAWWDAVGHRGASPRTAELVHAAMVAGDARDVLADVHAPVLLLSRLGGTSYDPEHGRYLARHLPHARLVEWPDPNDPWFLGDTARVLAEFDRWPEGPRRDG